MRQNMESGKKKLATRSFSFILALVFVFSIFSGAASVGKIQEENNNNTTLTVTLETAPPNLTSFAPPSPVYDTVCNLRTFYVTVNQTVNVSWYLNESFLFTNESVTEASCTLHAEVIGKHNVSAIVSNPSGTDMQTWIWDVLPTPTPTPAVSTNVTETTGASYINITAGEAKQMMGENRRIVILDVRPFAEYKSGHIEGAKSLPFSNMSCGTCLHAFLDKNRDKTLLVYCKSGIKSEDACNILVNYEFEKVYNMMGGLNAWEDAGFPVVSDSNDSFSSEIDDRLSSGKPVFLFFCVDWCHFCQQQIPIIDELEQEYADNITFICVNGEEHPEAVREFGVNGVPTMFLIMGKGDDGQYESQYFRGFTDKETLKKNVDYILKIKTENINDDSSISILSYDGCETNPSQCQCSGARCLKECFGGLWQLILTGSGTVLCGITCKACVVSVAASAISWPAVALTCSGCLVCIGQIDKAAECVGGCSVNPCAYGYVCEPCDVKGPIKQKVR
jgi:rhodanese-related sulfurtransferase